MMPTCHARSFATAGIAALLAACTSGSDLPVTPASEVSLLELGALEWSEPVWLGPVINSPQQDVFPRLSPDGTRLYFHSNRPGGHGMTDIWVARRSHDGCPWEAPTPLPPPINTSAADADLALWPNDRRAYFASDRAGGLGRGDIYLTRRTGPKHEEEWSEPVHLGSFVNTPEHESVADFFHHAGGGELYFNRLGDMYVVRIGPDGMPLGPAESVDEINSSVADGSGGLRRDGRELVFWSGGAAGMRPGSVGLADLWVSTRETIDDPWSEPRNLGLPVNSTNPEFTPGLSLDGRTLLFSAREGRGGLGLFDIWMSTRGERQVTVPRACP